MLGLLLLALMATGPRDADLQVAVKAHDLARVRELLDAGANVNARDALGATPLHDAAWNGYQDLARLLIERHADVNARHLEAGSTPLHYAVIKDEKEMAELLLDHGADLAATYRSGATALHLAADRGYTDVAQLLLDRGADISARDRLGATALDNAADAARSALRRWPGTTPAGKPTRQPVSRSRPGAAAAAGCCARASGPTSNCTSAAIRQRP